MSFRLPFLSRGTHAALPDNVAWSGLDLLATGVLAIDEHERIAYANPAAENLFETSRQILLGLPIAELFGDVPALTAAFERSRASGSPYTEQELELGTGGRTKLHLSCTVSPLDMDNASLLLEFRHIDQQLKIAREERINEQQQANRELIRSLAHEIKNPLGGIRGAAQLLERELERPQLIEYTQVIIGESDRLQSLVNRLLTPHRLPNYRRTNIHEVLVRVKGVVQAEFPSVPVYCDFDTSLPEFEADGEQIMQAVLNVVRNAAQALGTTSNPRITLTTRIARYVTLAKRRHRLAVAIFVEDNGPGVPPDIRDRIFFPLVSGREGGSGLGLTIAQTFVAQHGGTLDCDSEPGHTTFSILLPLESVRTTG